MKIMHLATAIVVGAFAAPPLGGIAVHTATGAGGSIPGAGTGGGGTWNNGDPTAMPSSPFESSVEISGGVASVHSITFTDIVHGFIGDLQAVLVDPNGVGYNLFVRPGVGFNNSGFGSGRDFNGTYTFIESGAEFDLPTATEPAMPMTYGTGVVGLPRKVSVTENSAWLACT